MPVYELPGIFLSLWIDEFMLSSDPSASVSSLWVSLIHLSSHALTLAHNSKGTRSTLHSALLSTSPVNQRINYIIVTYHRYSDWTHGPVTVKTFKVLLVLDPVRDARNVGPVQRKRLKTEVETLNVLYCRSVERTEWKKKRRRSQESLSFSIFI